jgi:hypothetical protein
MDDIRDIDAVWSDYSEFEIPEAGATLVASEDFLRVVRARLISLANHFSWINQFVPDAKYEVEVLGSKINHEYKRRNKIINYYLATHEDKIPQSHRRSKDLMVAYVEGKIAVDKIRESDDKIYEMETSLVDKKRFLRTLKMKREALITSIESCQAIIDSMLWELKNGAG